MPGLKGPLQTRVAPPRTEGTQVRDEGPFLGLVGALSCLRGVNSTLEVYQRYENVHSWKRRLILGPERTHPRPGAHNRIKRAHYMPERAHFIPGNIHLRSKRAHCRQ